MCGGNRVSLAVFDVISVVLGVFISRVFIIFLVFALRPLVFIFIVLPFAIVSLVCCSFCVVISA